MYMLSMGRYDMCMLCMEWYVHVYVEYGKVCTCVC